MKKTARGLVEYALAQLGNPYWYGTFGQEASKELYDQKKRQYPEKYKWEYAPGAAGKKVHDCVGLYKGYLWCDGPQDDTPEYVKAQDMSANMLYAACETAGPINTMPDVPGVMVFYNYHTGVYVGNGEVVEARGHKYGVVKTKLTDRPWTCWGYAPGIEYEAPAQKTVSIELPVLKKGDKGESVKAMQTLLMGYGYQMKSESGKLYSADGSFGGATDRALKEYQANAGLEADGSCGRKTWTKLLGL